MHRTRILVASVVALFGAAGLLLSRAPEAPAASREITAAQDLNAKSTHSTSARLSTASEGSASQTRLDKPASEEAYLRELFRLSNEDKALALDLARKGDDWYASTGKSAEARKAMAITLLVDLGRMEEARSETLDFIVAYPQSGYRQLVQGVTGIHPRPHGPNNVIDVR